jgi:hypothetical protein
VGQPEGSALSPRLIAFRTWTVLRNVETHGSAIKESDRYIAAANSPDTRTKLPVGDDGPKTLRWVLAHKATEVARHLGHMDILREQFDEVTGR